jgi:putative membrane protein
MMYDYSGQGIRGGGGNDVWGFIFMLFTIALVVVGVIVAVRHFSRVAGYHQASGTALDLLEKRFAQGEIDTKEFTEKRKVLSE